MVAMAQPLAESFPLIMQEWYSQSGQKLPAKFRLGYTIQ